MARDRQHHRPLPRQPAEPLRALVDELPDGVLVAGTGGRLVYANAAAWRLLGLTGRADGQPPVGNVHELRHLAGLHADGGPQVSLAAWLDAHAAAHEPTGEQDVTLIGPTGTKRPVRCAAGPVTLDRGERGAWLRLRDAADEAAMVSELREERHLSAARTRDLARANVTAARLRSLVELAAGITSSEQPGALFDLVTSEAVRLVGADSACLFQLDDRGDTVVGRAAYGCDPSAVVGLRLDPAADRELADVVRAGRTSAHTYAFRAGSPRPGFLTALGVRSYAAVPLVASGRAHGVLYVNYVRTVHLFTAAELTFLETLTGYVSVALARLRVLIDLREAVASLQRALLPASFPAVPGVEIAARYRSASAVAQVGGDFYEVVRLADGRLAAAVGDVCGKGVTAAQHTARLRFELRAALAEGGTAGRVLGRFNRRVGDLLGMESFATVALLVLEPGGGACEWASAGHPPPLATHLGPRLLRFGGSLPVGLEPDAAFRTGRMHLPAGGGLVLYTDGVVDARGPDGAELGWSGLRSTVRRLLPADAETVAEGVLEAVTRHTDGALEDDVAVLVLRRPPVAV